MSEGMSNFEGSEVIGARMVIAKAGEGLSNALDMKPVELHTGEEVYVLVKTEVTDVTFKPSKEAPETRVRVHRLLTSEAMIVDAEVGEQLMAAQEAELANWREAQRIEEEKAAGVHRMFSGDVDDDETEFDEFDDEEDA